MFSFQDVVKGPLWILPNAICRMLRRTEGPTPSCISRSSPILSIYVLLLLVLLFPPIRILDLQSLVLLEAGKQIIQLAF